MDIASVNSYRIPVIVDIVLYLLFYVSYLIIYRRENILCFELMALPIAFIGLFFDDIIYPFSSDISSFFSVGNQFVKNKSEDIQMMAFFIFLAGCETGNRYRIKQKDSIVRNNYVSYDMLIHIITTVLLLLIVYDYITGVFSTWFYYSNSDIMDVDDRNQGLGHLTCLLLAATGVEIVRLRNKGVNSLKFFLKKINKLYLVEWIFISFLLVYSGNRNEMLLIALPLIVGYTVCVKKIPNRTILLAGAAGVVLMVLVGMTRKEEVSFSGSQLKGISFVIDFADLGYNTDYLIDYTDKNGTTNFKDLPSFLLSGIPYIGNVIIKALDMKGVEASASLTTDSVNSSSGLGTSLIGDLYYSAGSLWVVVFMYFLGYSLSRLYHSDKNINIYLLVFYSYMVANSVYYVRSAWAFPITVIEYAFTIIFLGSLVCRKYKHNYSVR